MVTASNFPIRAMLKMEEAENKPFSLPSNIIPTEIFNRHARTHLLCHIYCDNVSNNKAKTIGLEVSWLVGVVMLAGWVWGIYERTAADPESRVHTSTLDLHKIICSPNNNRAQTGNVTPPCPSQGWSLNKTSSVGKKEIDWKYRAAQSNLCVLFSCFPRSEDCLVFVVVTRDLICRGVEICSVSVYCSMPGGRRLAWPSVEWTMQASSEGGGGW